MFREKHYYSAVGNTGRIGIETFFKKTITIKWSNL